MQLRSADKVIGITPRRFSKIVGSFLGLVILVQSAAAQAEIEVDLELILAVDISGSVDLREGELLKRGHAEALRNPRVIAAIKGGFIGKIAVSYVEWAGHGHITTVVDWQIIKDKQSADEFALKILNADYDSASRTAISDMIVASIGMFKSNKFSGNRRVLDLAGDGANNIGLPVNVARDRAVREGIIINGIPILSPFSDGFKYRTVQYLDTYFHKCVIGGMGSFVVVANGFKDFARAIKRKLILEIAGEAPLQKFSENLPWPKGWLRRADLRFPKPDPLPRIDPHCLIGEERWKQRDWMNE